MDTNTKRQAAFGPLGTLALAALFALPVGATAQTDQPAPDQNAADIVNLEAFVVQADKVARPLNEVPSAVQPINADMLSEFHIYDATDIGKVAPALDIDISSPNNTIPSLRGLTYNPFSAVSPTVDTYVNEVLTDANSAFRSLYDMSDIEVLRGPEGALRAGTAPGGAILFRTQRPDLSGFGSSIQISASDRSLINTQLMANLPIIKGKLALRLAGLYDGDNANDAHNIVTGLESRSYTKSLRASLEWKPISDIDVNLEYQYMYQRRNVDYIVAGTNIFSGRTDLPATLSPFDYDSIQPVDDVNKFLGRNATLTVDWNLPGKNQFNVISSYGQNLSNSMTTVNPNNLVPNFAGVQDVSMHSEPFNSTLELRFGSVQHKFWNYSFGYYITKQWGSDGYVSLDGSQLSEVYTKVAAQPGTPYGVVYTKGSTITGDGLNRAFFTTQAFNITDNLKLEVGARAQQSIQNSTQILPLYLNILAYGVSVPVGNSNSQTNLNAKPTTYSGSLSYKISDDVHAYLSYGRSWRPGGTGTNTLGAAYANYFVYNPETANAFEAGIKSSFLHGKLQFNEDVYYQKFDGFQYYDTVPLRTNLTGQTLNSVAQFVVNGAAVAKGVELGLVYSLPYRFIFSVDGAYDEATWASGTLLPAAVKNSSGQYVFNTPGAYASYVDMSGQRVGDAPVFTVSPRIEWSLPVGKNELFARALLKYDSNRELDTANRDIVGGYSLLDLQAGVRSKDGKWEVTVWGKNVLDKKAVVSFQDPSAVFIWVSGFHQVVPTNPTEVGVTLNRRF